MASLNEKENQVHAAVAFMCPTGEAIGNGCTDMEFIDGKPICTCCKQDLTENLLGIIEHTVAILQGIPEAIPKHEH